MRQRALLIGVALAVKNSFRSKQQADEASRQAAARVVVNFRVGIEHLVLQRFQVYFVKLELDLKGPIGHPAPLAQEGNRLIHHRDKVHAVSSFPGTGPVCTCAPS